MRGNPMVTRYALTSVTADHYAGAVPFMAWTWSHAGYTPLVLMMGSQSEWQRGYMPHVVSELRDTGARLEWVSEFPIPPWSHVPRFHWATGSRRPAAALLPDPADYVVVSDADMLLIQPSAIAPDYSTRLYLYGANAFKGYRFPRYPTCYQGATAATWREILDVHAADLPGAVWEHMERSKEHAVARWGVPSPDLPPGVVRGWDCEPGMQYYLERWPGYPDACQMVPMGPRWQTRERPENPVDAHVRQDWTDDAVWAALLPLIPEAVRDRCDSYRRSICDAVRGH